MAALCLAPLMFSGCGSKEQTDQAILGAISASPTKLDGEQLILSEKQVQCGVQNELWEAPATVGDRTTARLLAPAKQLNFDDDVVVREPGSTTPYVQVRGSFTLEVVGQQMETKDDGQNAKFVTGKIAARISHSCFPNSVPLMGIKKRQFSPDTPPVIRVYLDRGDWKVDGLIH
jgi:hypothetical protein